MSETVSRINTSVSPFGSAAVVRVDSVFPTDAADLWSAITEPERLARWIGEVSGDLQLGGEFHITFTSSWSGPGRVDVCDAPRRLSVTMAPGTDEETVIEATISADADGSRLVVEDRGLPVAEAPLHGAGWQVHIEDLDAYLAGRPTSDWRTRWQELIPSFRD